MQEKQVQDWYSNSLPLRFCLLHKDVLEGTTLTTQDTRYTMILNELVNYNSEKGHDSNAGADGATRRMAQKMSETCHVTASSAKSRSQRNMKRIQKQVHTTSFRSHPRNMCDDPNFFPRARNKAKVHNTQVRDRCHKVSTRNLGHLVYKVESIGRRQQELLQQKEDGRPLTTLAVDAHDVYSKVEDLSGLLDSAIMRQHNSDKEQTKTTWGAYSQSLQ